MKKFTLVVACLSLAGCARVERYSRKCENGDGAACQALEVRCHEGNEKACAYLASYERTTHSQYVGNESFEISSRGVRGIAPETIREYAYRKAFESCAERGKGFVLVKQDDTTTSGIHTHRGLTATEIREYEVPRARMLIKCEGKIDPELSEKYE